MSTMQHPTPSAATLFMSEEASAEAPEDDGGSSEEAEEQGEPEAPAENLEVTALKEEIAKLEATLAEEKSKLEAALEECEEYSKTGYARKVADMENMKRVRSVSTVKRMDAAGQPHVARVG
jgi:molecular chaperone GrpE (heat shock protein)